MVDSFRSKAMTDVSDKIRMCPVHKRPRGNLKVPDPTMAANFASLEARHLLMKSLIKAGATFAIGMGMAAAEVLDPGTSEHVWDGVNKVKDLRDALVRDGARLPPELRASKYFVGAVPKTPSSHCSNGIEPREGDGTKALDIQSDIAAMTWIHVVEDSEGKCSYVIQDPTNPQEAICEMDEGYRVNDIIASRTTCVIEMHGTREFFMQTKLEIEREFINEFDPNRYSRFDEYDPDAPEWDGQSLSWIVPGPSVTYDFRRHDCWEIGPDKMTQVWFKEKGKECPDEVLMELEPCCFCDGSNNCRSKHGRRMLCPKSLDCRGYDWKAPDERCCSHR